MKIFARIIKSDFYSNFLIKGGFLVAVMALCAVVVFAEQAFAEAGASLTFTVNVPSDSLLEIKLFNADGTEMGSNTSMNVVPSMSAAGFNEKEVVVSVGTNNEWGYNLMMNVDNTSLVSSSDSSKTIPSLEERDTAYTCTKDTADTCDFTLNSWGFQIKDDTASQFATNGYIAIPNSIELNKNTTTTNGDPTHILFGSKINAQQAPGAYSTTINFVATANPEPCNGEMLGGSCIVYFQDITSANIAKIKSDMVEEKAYQIKDNRDNPNKVNNYSIAKLKDGNIWMLDNLALDLTDSTVQSKLTEDTTNASNTTLGYLKNGGGSSPYTAYAVAAATSTNYYDRPAINTASFDKVPTDSLSTTGGWKVGVYYNYCAASAGSYCYTSSSSSGNATEDICPKGWRMPGGSSTIALTATPPTGEYQNLYNQYNNYADFRNAFHLPLSGNFRNGSANFQGSYGYFWSSTRYYDYYMYYLYAGTSSINPATSNDRDHGFSVRCVAGS